MDLLMLKGHPTVQISGKRFIIDTGSPISFNYCGVSYLEINGVNYNVGNTPACSKGDLDELTGSDIDGLIGLDIIRTNGITVDMENKFVDFSCDVEDGCSDSYCFISFDFFMGSYIVTNDIFLGKKLNNAIIDTGAPIPYVSSRLIPLFEKSGEMYKDLSPSFGVLQGELLYGDLFFDVGEKRVKRRIKVGQMPQILDMFGMFDAILGITALTDKRVVLDFANKVIGIKL